MATIRFTGNAGTVAQVDSFTPANVEVSDIFTLTATGLDGNTVAISFTAAATTVANVTAGLTAAWNASTNSLCTVITAADETTYMTLTADTPGVAFSVAATAVNGGANDTQTLTRAVVTANSGPSDWSCAANWSGGAVPGGDADQDVFVEGAIIYFGLDQSAIANALTSLTVKSTRIGTNPASGYLPTYLQIKTSALNIDPHYLSGTQSCLAPIIIDTGETACVIKVYNSGTNSPATKPAVIMKANNAATALEVRKGQVGLAVFDGETATIGTLTESYSTNINNDAFVFLGSGVTVTTINKTGGHLTSQSGATTITQDAGVLLTEGSGAVATMNVKGGTTYPNSTGTIAALNMTGGTTDMTKGAAARTVTTAKLDPGAVFKLDPAIVTLTNQVQPYSSSGVIQLTAA